MLEPGTSRVAKASWIRLSKCWMGFEFIPARNQANPIQSVAKKKMLRYMKLLLGKVKYMQSYPMYGDLIFMF